MSGAYMGDGRRRSSMTHAKRGHQCSFCDTVSFGNGGQVSHARAHVRRGEAVELLKYHGMLGSAPQYSRLWLAPDDDKIPDLLARGFEQVDQ